MFSEEQIKELKAPLERIHVKQRDKGSVKLSYIEGWHAIREANRIFGFDGWTRNTLSNECVYQGEYKGNATVTYMAKVSVHVEGIGRSGTGLGHGFSKLPGEAHESAAKEAETDAMKRALMTFGNPFGLALYDKTQAEVTDSRSPLKSKGKADTSPHDTPRQGAWKGPMPAMRLKAEAKDMMQAIQEQPEMDDLTAYLRAETVMAILDQLEHDLPDWFTRANEVIEAKKDELRVAIATGITLDGG